MKVITLNPDDLNFYSKRLAQKILNSPWKPELIIGIKTGGIYVAKPLYDEISKEMQSLYNSISLSRPSTEKKKRLKVSKVLKKLPYFISNILRNIEVFLFEMSKSKNYLSDREKEIFIDEILQEQILSCKNILLVDDAIDTGTTIVAIKNRFLYINNEVDIKVAVLTTTHKVPFVDADFSLFNRVLLRCPWAQDYKSSN